MGKKILTFTSRQVMHSKDFELFHYSDNVPINVEYHNHDFYEIFFFISGKVKYIIEGKISVNNSAINGETKECKKNSR